LHVTKSPDKPVKRLLQPLRITNALWRMANVP
jgi:hypothetical protein